MEKLSEKIDTTIIDGLIKKGDRESLDLAFMLLLGHTTCILDCCLYFFEKTYQTEVVKRDKSYRQTLFYLPFLGELVCYGHFGNKRRIIEVRNTYRSINNVWLIFEAPFVMRRNERTGRYRKRYFDKPKKTIRNLIINDIRYHIASHIEAFNPLLWEQIRVVKRI